MHPETNAPLLQPCSPRSHPTVKYTTMKRVRERIKVYEA